LQTYFAISILFMKNYRPLILLLFIPLLWISCETDFDLNAEWKDITVVYGILNQNEDVHYIRIQKAYLGQGNVMQMAMEADSNLYPNNLNVMIQEWNNTTLVRTLELDTITIKDKEPGIFFSPDQPLYFTQASLNPAYRYKLLITNQNTGKVISSECELVGDFGITTPAANTQINFNIPTNPTKTFAWRPAKNAGRYQVILRFNYLDVVLGTTDTIARQIEWYSPVVKSGNTSGGGDIELKFSNETFFSMVETQIPKIENIIRYPVNVELVFYVAATDLSTYIEVNEPSSSLVQERPEYTNIENGLGVFSARYDKTSVHRIHFQTINRLLEMDGHNFQWVP
jgi:hypothetical protein